MDDLDDNLNINFGKKEEEEEWDEDEEEIIEEDEEVVEEDEEEEDEEEEKKPVKKEEPKVKEEKPAEKPQKPEEKPKEEKKPEPPKPAEPKKPPEPKPEKKPKTPEEMLKMGKIVFLAGLAVFFLSTCAERSHLHNIAGATYSCFKYSHEADEPVKPLAPYQKASTKIDPKERGEENAKIKEEYDKAREEFEKGEAMQKYLVAMEEWRQDKHEDSVSLDKAKIAMEKAKMKAGAWACTRYYAGQIGLLLMIIGMGLVILHGSPAEKAAALVLVWIGVISVMNGGLLTGGSAIQNLLGLMR